MDLRFGAAYQQTAERQALQQYRVSVKTPDEQVGLPGQGLPGRA